MGAGAFGEADVEGRTFIGTTLKAHLTAQEVLPQELHGIGAQPASLFALGAEGSLENGQGDAFGNNAFVPYEEGGLVLFDPEADLHTTSTGDGLQRIDAHVHDDAQQDIRVRFEHLIRGRNFGFEIAPAGGWVFSTGTVKFFHEWRNMKAPRREQELTLFSLQNQSLLFDLVSDPFRELDDLACRNVWIF